MTSRNLALAAALLLGVPACGGGYNPEVGVGVAYVDRGPPRNRYEIRGNRPGHDMMWISGHWRWTGRDYDWVPGRWSAIHPGSRSWSPGRWRHNRNGWYWQDGRWR
jgi:hypothetical protein